MLWTVPHYFSLGFSAVVEYSIWWAVFIIKHVSFIISNTYVESTVDVCIIDVPLLINIFQRFVCNPVVLTEWTPSRQSI